MRSYLSCLATILTVLLSCGVTGVPHEDYDSSDVDISVLTFYLEKALDHLDRSLEHGSAGDVESAVSETELFRSQVQRADDTLSAIPEWIDSYSYLKDNIDVLSGTDRNLSMFMMALRDLERDLLWLESFSVSSWTVTSLSENLTRLDVALVSIPGLIDTLHTSAIDLGANIRSLGTLNLSVDGAEEDIASILAKVEDGLPDLDPRPYLEMVMAPIMDGWASDLGMLFLGSDPLRSYAETAMVLERSSVDLSQTIKGPIDTVLEALDEVGPYMDGFRNDQIGFLSSLGDLEDLISNKGPITLQMLSHDSASRSIVGMVSSLHQLEILYLPTAEWDPGGVRDGLNELRELLAVYRMDLGSLKMVFKELEDLGSSVQLVLLYNAIQPDHDLDGSLSDDEFLSIELPEDAFVELERAYMIRDRIRSIVRVMESQYYETYRETIDGLENMVLYSDLLARSHRDFLRNVSESLMSDGDSSSTLFSAIDHLSNMEMALDGIRQSFWSFDVDTVGMDSGVLPDLESMIGLYGKTIERLLLETGFDSTIVLSLDRDIVPYDGSVRIQVIVLQMTEAGIIVRPSGMDVNLTIDGIPTFVLNIEKGKARYDFRVPWEMGLGDNPVLVNISLDGGMTFIEDRSAFEVRRILTEIRSNRSEGPIAPGETTILGAVLHDEFDRIVDGDLDLDGTLVSTNGTYYHSFTPLDTGSYSFEFGYGGDDHHQPAISIFTVNVTAAPVMDLIVEKEVVRLGDPINTTVRVVSGSGHISIHTEGVNLPMEGRAENGSILSDQLDSSLFGEGLVHLEAWLTSDRQWCRDGISEPVDVLILSESDYEDWLDEGNEDEERPPIVEPPETPENETPVDVFDPLPEDPDTWGDIKEALANGGWIWISILFAVGISTLLISAVLRRKRGTAPIGSPDPDHGDVGTGPAKPGTVRKAISGRHQGLVNTYVDVIENAPEGSGLRIQMTPREISRNLPSDPRSTLVSFESKVYDPTSSEDDDTIIHGLNGFRNWLSVRFGPGNRGARP